MRRVPFNDVGRQYRALKPEIDQAVSSVLTSGWYLLGEQTRAFEEEFARLCRVPHCVGVANGTDALELAIRASGFDRDSEVITVANAGGYATTAIRLVGAVPVYVDILPDTHVMDVDAAVAAVTPRTRAIVVTHLYGRAADVLGLKERLKKKCRGDIIVIEDCAQAHGAELAGHAVGSLGDLATFSFYPTKNIGALGDAGAVTSSSGQLVERIRSLAQYGWYEKYRAGVPFGCNSRMDELQAAILRVKLPLLQIWNRRRREIIGRYREAAPRGVQVLPTDGSAHAGHLAVATSFNRSRVRAQLADRGVATAIHYPVIDPEQDAMRGLDQVVHDLSHSRVAADQVFSLPCFPELEDAEVDYVCEQLSKVDVA